MTTSSHSPPPPSSDFSPTPFLSSGMPFQFFLSSFYFTSVTQVFLFSQKSTSSSPSPPPICLTPLLPSSPPSLLQVRSTFPADQVTVRQVRDTFLPSPPHTPGTEAAVIGFYNLLAGCRAAPGGWVVIVPLPTPASVLGLWRRLSTSGEAIIKQPDPCPTAARQARFPTPPRSLPIGRHTNDYLAAHTRHVRVP